MLAACSNGDIGVLKEMLAKDGKIETADAQASNRGNHSINKQHAFDA